MSTTSNTFQVGTTYYARSAANYDCVWGFEVIARTAKFVTLREDDDTMRVGVKTDAEGEWALPFGTYSMAPVIRANRDSVRP